MLGKRKESESVLQRMFSIGPGQLSRNLAVLSGSAADVGHAGRGKLRPGEARRAVKHEAKQIEDALLLLAGDVMLIWKACRIEM